MGSEKKIIIEPQKRTNAIKIRKNKCKRNQKKEWKKHRKTAEEKRMEKNPYELQIKCKNKN